MAPPTLPGRGPLTLLGRPIAPRPAINQQAGGSLGVPFAYEGGAGELAPMSQRGTNMSEKAPVRIAVIGAGDVKLREGGCLADIAPTMLPYIGLPVPAEMTGKSIIE